MADEAMRQWLESAETDLRAVAHLLRDPDPVPDAASFHVQQAAEKLVKAVLVGLDIDPPKSHDIGRLVAMLPDGLPIDADLAGLSVYTPLLALYRYPVETREPVPTVAEVRSWLEHVLAVLGRVTEWKAAGSRA